VEKISNSNGVFNEEIEEILNTRVIEILITKNAKKDVGLP
jgi:hypothetical protein